VEQFEHNSRQVVMKSLKAAIAQNETESGLRLRCSSNGFHSIADVMVVIDFKEVGITNLTLLFVFRGVQTTLCVLWA
jgi:hypothetical protein